MNAETEVARLLKDDGAVLTRQNKHEIWKLSNGETFVKSSTPSDTYAPNNQLRDLRHKLGLVRNKKDIPILKPKGVPKPKPKGAKPVPRKLPINPNINNEISEKLRLSGILEETLRSEITQLKEQINNCCWCRFKRWIKSLQK